jgi:fructuronate reductase
LRPQDYLYSLIVETPGKADISIIGALCDIVAPAPGNSDDLLNAIASPETKVITITVTEKGYKLDPSSGLLLDSDPEVQRDLRRFEAPITLPGYLASGLKRRKERGFGPLTLISCDNMGANGSLLRASVGYLARAHDPNLAAWIDQECAFPNTVVDRIVPATRKSDVVMAQSYLQLTDLATVRTEPFYQWVIEDRFCGTRPELECAGVRFSSDVDSWERAKLRMLNGAHSAMAYLGGLAGVTTVNEFVAQDWGRRIVELLWDEVQVTLGSIDELGLPQYRAQLMSRFANQALQHRLLQIATDGSQKIPHRLAAPALELLEKNSPPTIVALAIAAWMQWQRGTRDDGSAIVVDDPLATTTKRLMASTIGVKDQVRALLSIASIFPTQLSSDSTFSDLVVEHLQNLQRMGASAAAQLVVRGTQ